MSTRKAVMFFANLGADGQGNPTYLVTAFLKDHQGTTTVQRNVSDADLTSIFQADGIPQNKQQEIKAALAAKQDQGYAYSYIDLTNARAIGWNIPE